MVLVVSGAVVELRGGLALDIVGRVVADLSVDVFGADVVVAEDVAEDIAEDVAEAVP